MTYHVSAGTLNPTHSIDSSVAAWTLQVIGARNDWRDGSLGWKRSLYD